MANSSIFRRPQKTAPLLSSFAMAVPVYGLTYFSSILLAHVNGWPRTASKSLSPTGMPSRTPSDPPFARRASDFSAADKVDFSSQEINAPTLSSTEFLRSIKAFASSTAEISPDANISESSTTLL